MSIPSPFDGLEIDRELVCEFFAVFSRFEFALKEADYIRNERGVVEPAWWGFAEEMKGRVNVEPSSEFNDAIDYLCKEPPQVQTGPQNWENRALHGEDQIEQAIDATRRVRHNLFHGGKHTPHSPPGRDEKLVLSSLAVLYGCLEENPHIRDVYEQNRF